MKLFKHQPPKSSRVVGAASKSKAPMESDMQRPQTPFKKHGTISRALSKLFSRRNSTARIGSQRSTTPHAADGFRQINTASHQENVQSGHQEPTITQNGCTSCKDPNASDAMSPKETASATDAAKPPEIACDSESTKGGQRSEATEGASTTDAMACSQDEHDSSSNTSPDRASQEEVTPDSTFNHADITTSDVQDALKEALEEVARLAKAKEELEARIRNEMQLRAKAEKQVLNLERSAGERETTTALDLSNETQEKEAALRRVDGLMEQCGEQERQIANLKLDAEKSEEERLQISDEKDKALKAIECLAPVLTQANQETSKLRKELENLKADSKEQVSVLQSEFSTTLEKGQVHGRLCLTRLHCAEKERTQTTMKLAKAEKELSQAVDELVDANEEIVVQQDTNKVLAKQVVEARAEAEHFREKSLSLQYAMEDKLPLACEWQETLKTQHRTIQGLRKDLGESQDASELFQSQVKEQERQQQQFETTPRAIIEQQAEKLKVEGDRVDLYARRFKGLLDDVENIADGENAFVKAARKGLDLAARDVRLMLRAKAKAERISKQMAQSAQATLQKEEKARFVAEKALAQAEDELLLTQQRNFDLEGKVDLLEEELAARKGDVEWFEHMLDDMETAQVRLEQAGLHEAYIDTLKYKDAIIGDQKKRLQQKEDTIQDIITRARGRKQNRIIDVYTQANWERLYAALTEEVEMLRKGMEVPEAMRFKPRGLLMPSPEEPATPPGSPNQRAYDILVERLPGSPEDDPPFSEEDLYDAGGFLLEDSGESVCDEGPVILGDGSATTEQA